MDGHASPTESFFRRGAAWLAGTAVAAIAQAQAVSPDAAPTAAAMQQVSLQPTPLTAIDPGPTACTADLAAAALARLNQLRASGGDCRSAGQFGPAPALSWSTHLRQAALAHSQDMASHDYFSHISADGRSLDHRVAAVGYAWRGLGENIAAGPTTFDAAVAAWLESDAHCAKLMSTRYTQVGVACAPGLAGSTYGSYWTMDFGLAR